MKKLAVSAAGVFAAAGFLCAQQPPGLSLDGLVGGAEGARANPYSRLFSSMAGTSSILYGQAPLAYQILGLSNEQAGKIAAIGAKAKEEYEAVRKSRPAVKPGEKSAADYKSFWAEMNAKRQELAGKYAAEMRGVLTDEQKAAIEKIEAAVKAKTDSDQKARDAMLKAQQDSMAAFEAAMQKALTAQQKAKLEEAMKAAAPGAARPIQAGQ